MMDEWWMMNDDYEEYDEHDEWWICGIWWTRWMMNMINDDKWWMNDGW